LLSDVTVLNETGVFHDNVALLCRVGSTIFVFACHVSLLPLLHSEICYHLNSMLPTVEACR